MSGKDDTVDTSSKIVKNNSEDETSTLVKKDNSDILMPGENDVRKVSECSTSTVNQGEFNATGGGYEHSSESLEEEMNLRWDDEDDSVELIKHACGEPTCEPDKTQASPETGIIEVEEKATGMNSSQSDLSIKDSHLEHGVNKPNVMLHIPGMLPNMDREMDQLNLHLSSDDNEFNLDKDLADSISKIESGIVESMAALDEDIIKETSNDKLHYSSECEELNEPELDEKLVQSLDCKDESNGGTEIQEKLELSSEIEEDLLADENSEMVVKSLTDPIASIEEHLSSDDNEFNIDKDLADSISKIESDIVESMAALDEDIIKETANDKLQCSSECEELNEPESDEKLVQSLDCEDESNGGTEIQEKLELSSEIEEDLLADENSELVVKSLTDTIASIEELDQTETSKDRESSITMSQALTEETVSKESIENEVKLLAETMSSIDEERPLKVILDVLKTGLPASVQSETSGIASDEESDEPMEHQATPSEQRAKVMNLKVSTLISNIEEEMQLLDSGDEMDESSKVPDENVSQPTEIDIRKEPPIVKGKIQKPSVKKIKPTTQSVKKVVQDEKSAVIETGSDKVLDSELRLKDTEISTATEPEPVHTELDENELRLKEQNELELAVKAIEQNYEVSEPTPAVTIVNTAFEPSEIPIADEDPSTALMIDDDDDSIEEVQLNTAENTVHESQISVIQDSDDEMLVSDTEDVAVNDIENDTTQSSSLTLPENREEQSIQPKSGNMEIKETDFPTSHFKDKCDQEESLSVKQKSTLNETIPTMSEKGMKMTTSEEIDEMKPDVLVDGTTTTEEIVATKKTSEEKPTNDSRAKNTAEKIKGKQIIDISQASDEDDMQVSSSNLLDVGDPNISIFGSPAVALEKEKGTETTVKHKVREVTEKTKVTEIIGTNENKENMEKTKDTETIETGITDKQKGPESIDKHIVTKITEIIEDTIITVKKKDSETTEIYKDTHITEYIKETLTTEKNQDTVITDIIKETGTKEKYKDLELTEMNIDTDITENKNTEISEKIDDAENCELPEKLDQEPVEMEPQPSTSLEMSKDSSNDVPDSDALGLLAESTRVMRDDDDQDDDEDDEDFYHDDESNLMTAEHSDDSNQNSDNAQDMPEDKEAHVTESTDVSVAGDRFSEEFDTPEHRENEFQFTISSVTNDVPTIDDSANQSEASTVESIQKIDSEIEQQSIESSCEAVTKDVIEMSSVKGTDTVKEHTSGGDADISTKAIEPVPKAEEQVEPASRTKKLSRCTTVQPVLNFVELEESSEDEVQVVAKPVEVDSETESPQPEPEKEHPEVAPAPPKVSETDTDMQMEVLDEEYLKLNETSLDEAAIDVDESTTPTVEPTTELNIEPTDEPEPTVETTKLKTKTTVGLEVFNLDSDDEDSAAPVTTEATAPPVEPEQTKGGLKCINSGCKSKADARVYPADAAAVAFYNGDKWKRMLICEDCLQPVLAKNSELIEGIRSFMPLLELDMNLVSMDLVEISDSESEDEAEGQEVNKETLGEKGAKFIEENLADILNDTWVKYQMDSRLSDTESVLQMELRRLEAESNEIRSLLRDCQATTDRMRNELYASFPHDIKHVPPLVIYDTPEQQYCYIQAPLPESDAEAAPALPTRTSKRKLEAAAMAESAAKRPAIPMGYTPLEQDNQKFEAEKTDDDNPDVSVVNIIASEVAPPGLPANGELIRPPVQVGMEIYAMRNAFGSWQRGIILEVLPKLPIGNTPSFTMCKVKFDSKQMKNPIKILSAQCMAFAEPASVRMTIGTRVIADFKDDKDAKPTTESKRESFFSGIVAEVPNPVNKYRYLIFFDDGYAQYASHADTRLVCECSTSVWEEVHPFSRDFVKEYLLAYPERPMVRLHAFQSLKTEWNGKWWSSRVVQVDASLAQVYFPSNNRYEWIYRGSTRLAPLYLELQAAERHRSRAMPRAQAHARVNMPVVEYTRFDENSSKTAEGDKPSQEQRQEAEVTRQRAVAKKSTSAAPMPIQPPPRAPPGQNLDSITSRVVYYTPKNAVKPHKMVPHTCGPKCKRADVLALKDLRTYNPLAKPLLSGWERQVVRYKGHKGVMYRAPCGRRVRGMRELHRYLRATRSDLPVDLFDFSPSTHCLAEFVLNKCLIMKKDLSQGKENVPIPCVNYYDETLPEFCSYNTERTPTAGVPLNLDPEFLCGCDCEDDCEDKSKCACWKLTLEGARTIGLKGNNVGYVYKRLPEPLPSGIYECNSRCKCKHTCLNRVAQHPLQLKLQIFKTLNRGWGIRALNDVPKGAFLCVYAGNLLTDATANLDGLNEGDEYLAELDYIEVVEQMKEGYEEDIPKELKKIGAKRSSKSDEESEEETQSSEEEAPKTSKNEMEDQDFQPNMPFRVTEFSKRLRRRASNKGEKGSDEGKGDGEGEKEKKKETEQAKKGRGDDDCITISDDDDEVREPSSFAAAAGMGSSAFVSKYRSVRDLFGEDEACYIMDAKVQGNIGRYLNHSCSPNVFVQNVFVDTHDPRFPWVAFFALAHVRAGAELTWNYNYDVGSVPGKALYCYCGAANCRGRLL